MVVGQIDWYEQQVDLLEKLRELPGPALHAAVIIAAAVCADQARPEERRMAEQSRGWSLCRSPGRRWPVAELLQQLQVVVDDLVVEPLVLRS